MGIINDKFELRAYSKKELAEKYQVSVKTFDKWLKPFSEKKKKKRGRFYTVNQVKTMLEVLGVPGTVN